MKAAMSSLSKNPARLRVDDVVSVRRLNLKVKNISRKCTDCLKSKQATVRAVYLI